MSSAQAKLAALSKLPLHLAESMQVLNYQVTIAKPVSQPAATAPHNGHGEAHGPQLARG